MISRWKLLAATSLVIVSALPMTAARGEAALVIRDTQCTFFDGNGQLVTLDASHVVVTSQGGKRTCSGFVTPSASGKTVHYDFFSTGLFCNTGGAGQGITTNWRETVTPSGRALVTCVVR